MDIFEKNNDKEYRFILPDGTTEKEAKAHSINSEELCRHIGQGKTIEIRNAHIAGSFNLRGKTISSEIIIRNTVFDEGINWAYTEFEKVIHLIGCTIEEQIYAMSSKFLNDCALGGSIVKKSCDFRSSLFHGNVSMVKSIFKQRVNFDSCEFKKNIYLNQARFEGNFSIASAIVSKGIQAPACVFCEDAVWAQVRINRDIHCREAEFKKALLFHNAFVGRSITLTDCKFSNFNFNNSEVHGNLSLSNSQFHGKVTIIGATIYGNLSLSNCDIGKGLTLNSTSVKGHVKGEELSIQGDADFSACNIEGGLDLSKAHCMGFIKFRLSRIRLAIKLRHARFEKALDMGYCKTGELALCRKNIESSKAINLVGAEFNNIESNIELSDLVNAQEPFSLQPFTYMEAHFRKIDEHLKADTIYYLARKRNSKNISIKEFPRWVSDIFHWLFAGYGVKNYRALMVVCFSFALAFLVFSQPDALRLYPICNDIIPNEIMSNEASVYDVIFTTLRHLLPIPDIPRACGWQPTDHTLFWIHYTSYATILEIIGWIFIPFAISGFAGFLKR